MTFMTIEEMLPPLPADHESACKEIRRLQKQLITQNQRIEKNVVKQYHDRKSCANGLKQLRAQLKEAEETLTLVKRQLLAARTELAIIKDAAGRRSNG